MAEPKKSSDKIKRSARKTTGKTEAELIGGAAVEKPVVAGFVASSNIAAKSQNQTSMVRKRRWLKMLGSQSVTPVIASFAALVALLALAVSVITYRQTADLASPGQPESSNITTAISQAELDQLRQRLDKLAASNAQNTNDYLSLQQQLANMVAEKDADRPTSPSLADTAETVLSDKASSDDAITPPVAFEADGANQISTQAIPDGSAEQYGFETAHIGLLAAAGLLTENLAGHNLEIWVDVFDKLQWPGIDPTDRDTISRAAQAPVESRADLLTLGRLQLTQMVQNLNKSQEGAGLLEHARARLANVVQLRRTGSGSDQPEAVLASFEIALDNSDFDAAFAAANLWASDGLGGLESWLVAAQRRQDIDRAVNQLVATFVMHAAGKS